MSYSIFRVKGITNTGAFKGLCKHDKERVSNTNPDIDHEQSINNIDLVPCDSSYKEKFNNITAQMRAEHEERMQHMRSDRVKTFEQYINGSHNNVATEMLFTSDEAFFKGMDREDIQKWAETSLDFVTKEIGIPKSNIIHAVVHLDEKTPHMHVVAVPLIREYEKRAKAERWSIKQNKFIGNRKDLSRLQDKYNDLMRTRGYDLERGQKGTLKQHKETIEYKKEQLNKTSERLSKVEDDKELLATRLGRVEAKKSIIGHKMTISEKDYKELVDLAHIGQEYLYKNDGLKNYSENLKQSIDHLHKLLDYYQTENKKLDIENSAYKKALKDMDEILKRMGVMKNFNETYRELKAERERDKEKKISQKFYENFEKSR